MFCPLMVIGGYRFRGFDWDDKASPRTAQLTELANEIDRAIRAAVATLAPEGVYPTEPNLLIKGIDAVGVRIGGLADANPALAIANMKTLVELAGQGKLRPRISHRFRLEQAAEAVQAVIDRAVIGKAVLVG